MGRTALDLSREIVCPFGKNVTLYPKVFILEKCTHHFASSSLANEYSIVMETFGFSQYHDISIS
jgi:hypothetical protein